jgi:tRNA(Ile)-lysidine synthase
MLQNAKKQIQQLKKSLLLGLSGGPDSMCLFSLLLECNRSFHVAHIDHGLRPESGEEKAKLEALAKKHHIPFHSIQLKGIQGHNLEETLRDKRLEFFQKVMIEQKLEVLLLGHQQDEQAETIIKRFFEGGLFLHLEGIKKERELKGLCICRPLIQSSKNEIIDYLNKKGFFYFTDPSNFTTANLRGRMRIELLPLLEKAFGKSIRTGVCDIGEQIQECSHFLEEKIQEVRRGAIVGFCGIFYPFEKWDPYLYKMMIYKILSQLGIVLSRDQRKRIHQGVIEKLAGKEMIFNGITLFFEEMGMFIIDQKNYKSPCETIEERVFWLDFWKNGKGEEGGGEGLGKKLDKKGLSEFHRKRKTPICLRRVYPIPLTSMRK